jgi:hypothetical protein
MAIIICGRGSLRIGGTIGRRVDECFGKYTFWVAVNYSVLKLTRGVIILSLTAEESTR